MLAYFRPARHLGTVPRMASAALFAALLLGAFAAPIAAQVLDADNDGIYDADEAFYGANPQYPDTDGDGLRDGFEVYEFGSSPALMDTDGDKLSDYGEWVYGTAPRNPDTDGDGVTDGDEYFAGTDPKVRDAAPAPAPGQAERPDSDGDGLFDDDETNVYRTKPHVPDTDGDGIVDGQEVYDGTDPLTINAAP